MDVHGENGLVPGGLKGGALPVIILRLQGKGVQPVSGIRVRQGNIDSTNKKPEKSEDLAEITPHMF